jgi:uncharacterized membrane protein (DUF2068 family)
MENYQPTPEVSAAKPARPTFLTVLCILTFIGSGWAIVSGISTYLTANATAGVAEAAMQDAREQIANAGESNAGSKMAEKMLSGASDVLKPENLKKSALFSIVAAVFTLLGAVLMFQLKKTGFWLYVLGTIISIVGPFVIFGAANLITMLSTIGTAFIGIIFVVLYALNLKHLR